ncbi:hypothetical protein QR680_014664 [Steinernema hermaphroditum]|uniref:F-box domain-containing protein n=1 Tax=Steinernema hermaphroditum TaxID=289476 RepID=A0AA39M3L6_9BILA|nr:hypothetical protein QR680_014664 [Steinernema hermaphroditum]
MEGVPYDFIDRVLNRLDSEVLYEIYTSIDDPSWKEIAIKYEKKRKYYRLHLYPSLEGPWSYELLDEERNHYRFEEISREDSRFVVFYILSIRQRSGLETSCELDRALVSDLIHLVAECTLKRTIAYLEVDLNQEFHDVQNQFMAEILQADLNVEILSITSFTPHSEAFVVKQMRLETMNDLVLGDWTRGSSWTENLKEPLGDFLFSSRYIRAQLCGSPMFDATCLKALISRWNSICSPISSRLVVATDERLEEFFESLNMDLYLKHKDGRSYIEYDCYKNTCSIEFVHCDDDFVK